MPQGIDDFTIVLPELTDMATCGLEMYDGLDRLWRMIERYKMAAPIAIRVVDNTARCIRVIRGTRDQAVCWHLEDVTTAGGPSRKRSRAPSNCKLARCQWKHFENETSLQSRRDN